MSFDEQPDGDPHGECAAEIHRLEQQRDELQLERDNYKSVAEAHSGAFQECIRLREQMDELLAALEKISCQTQSDNFLWWQIEAPAEGGSMSETLEQTALRVAAEMDNVYLRNVPAVVLQEFARRLVAAIGAQEPVAKTLGPVTNTGYSYVKALDRTIAPDSLLYAAPVVKEGYWPDQNCTCDEHGACAYCWNGKKHDAAPEYGK